MSCFQEGIYELLRDLAVVQFPVLLLRCLDWNSCCSAVLSCCYPAASATLQLWMGYEEEEEAFQALLWLRHRFDHAAGAAHWEGPSSAHCVHLAAGAFHLPRSPSPWHSQNILHRLLLSWLKMQSTATLGVQRGHSVYLWEQPVPQPDSGI